MAASFAVLPIQLIEKLAIDYLTAPDVCRLNQVGKYLFTRQKTGIETE
jgi:hypothetical protein